MDDFSKFPVADGGRWDEDDDDIEADEVISFEDCASVVKANGEDAGGI